MRRVELAKRKTPERETAGEEEREREREGEGKRETRGYSEMLLRTRARGIECIGAPRHV